MRVAIQVTLCCLDLNRSLLGIKSAESIAQELLQLTVFKRHLSTHIHQLTGHHDPLGHQLQNIPSRVDTTRSSISHSFVTGCGVHGQGGEGSTPTLCGATSSKKVRTYFHSGSLASVKSNRGPLAANSIGPGSAGGWALGSVFDLRVPHP